MEASKVDLAHKLEAMELFMERLLASPMGPQVLRIIHHGSTLRGDWHEESDVDLIIIASGDLRRLQEFCSNVSFDVILERGERVEALVFCPDEYAFPRGYFLIKPSKRDRRCMRCLSP